MQQLELQVRFDAGELTKAYVLPEPLGEHWNLMFQGKNKSDQYYVTLQRANDLRIFKTIDAAAKVAKRVGFVDVHVKFSTLT